MSAVDLQPQAAAAPAAKSGRRDIWLDVLRFAAIALVLGSHMDDCPVDMPAWLRAITDTWKRGGWTGVDLFFVLSGFLVSGLIFSEISRTGKVDLGRFLIRRGFKIYPAFWILIAFTIWFRLRNYGGWLTPQKILGELLFLQNYLGRMWDPHWSLAVEEHFYLLLALGTALSLKLARRAGREPFRHLPLVFVCTALGCLAVRWYNGAHYEFSLDRHLMPTHARIDSLLFGVLLCWAMRRGVWTAQKWSPVQRGLLLAVGAALFVPAFVFSFLDHWWVLVFCVVGFYLGGGMLVMAGQGISWRWPLPFRLAAFLGERSYSIYLWHYPFKYWLTSRLIHALHLPDTWTVRTLVYMGGAVVTGCVMAWIIEQPMLALRDRLFPARSKSLPAAIPA